MDQDLQKGNSVMQNLKTYLNFRWLKINNNLMNQNLSRFGGIVTRNRARALKWLDS